MYGDSAPWTGIDWPFRHQVADNRINEGDSGEVGICVDECGQDDYEDIVAIQEIDMNLRGCSDSIVFFEIPPRLLPPLAVCSRSIACDFHDLYFLCQLDADQGFVQSELQEESTEACTVFIKAAERGNSHILVGVKSLGFECYLARYMCCMHVGKIVVQIIVVGYVHDTFSGDLNCARCLPTLLSSFGTRCHYCVDRATFIWAGQWCIGDFAE